MASDHSSLNSQIVFIIVCNMVEDVPRRRQKHLYIKSTDILRYITIQICDMCIHIHKEREIPVLLSDVKETEI